jgi:N-methylhydantoinase A
MTQRSDRPGTSYVGIDVGGTFTDLAVSLCDGREILHKVPSTPGAPDRAILQGLSELIDQGRLVGADIARLAHGTTVGTNALIERKVGIVGVVTTRGFRDLLEIGRQTRPKVYDIHEDHPKPLVPRHLRLEVTERMRVDGVVHRALDEAELRAAGRRLLAAGVDCVAVCFLHAHAWPGHEQRAATILREMMGERVMVIASSDVHPEFREYERLSTTVLNGALLTVMHAYLERLERAVGGLGIACDPMVSQSAGGLMSIGMARRIPIRTALSGPAAGALGAAYRAQLAGFPTVITLDVGGTSADVAMLTNGEPALVHSRMLAGFPLRLPALDVNSVGAGGGSIAWIDRDGLLKVGPQSAGAMPGPACYGRGGEQATVTDAHVLLGSLADTGLLDGRMAIRRDLAEQAIAKLAQPLGLSMIETALGIVKLVCATMVKAIRSISVERGYDPADFALFAFGGAGPLHATESARELGIGTIVIPPYPGVLCAQGLLNSDLATDFVRTAAVQMDAGAAGKLEEVRASLRVQADAWFVHEGIAAPARRESWSVDLHYRGQNFELPVPMPPGQLDVASCRALVERFHVEHDRAYGFAHPNETVELVSMRVRLTAVLDKPVLAELPPGPPAAPTGARRVCFANDDWREVPLYRRDALGRDQRIAGPALFEQMDSTTLLFPGDACRVDRWGNLIIELMAETRL